MTIGQKSSLPQPRDPPKHSTRIDRVRLVLSPYQVPKELRPFRDRIGTVEGYVDDEVLVRFGEIVIQVPAEMLEPVE